MPSLGSRVNSPGRSGPRAPQPATRGVPTGAGTPAPTQALQLPPAPALPSELRGQREGVGVMQDPPGGVAGTPGTEVGAPASTGAAQQRGTPEGHDGSSDRSRQQLGVVYFILKPDINRKGTRISSPQLPSNTRFPAQVSGGPAQATGGG